MRRGPLVQTLVATLVSGALGLLFNLPHFPIFSDATLLLGGIFYLSIALLYGPLYGTLAAAITLLPDPALWHHPETMLILILEAPAVAWLTRRGIIAVVADLVYWVALGGPLATLLYVRLLHYPSPSGWVMAIAHPVNGLLNIMLAEVLSNSRWVQERARPTRPLLGRQSLRAQLTRGFLLVATVPLLLLTILNGQAYATRQQTEASRHLEEASTSIRHHLQEYVASYQSALLMLSHGISNQGRFDPDTLDRWLEQNHSIYPGFQTLSITDGQGVPIAVSPNRMPDGNPVLSPRGILLPDSATLRDRCHATIHNFGRLLGARRSPAHRRHHRAAADTVRRAVRRSRWIAAPLALRRIRRELSQP
jgi:two-component system, cell cycle sensor histidine kinase and response regulator CckA